MDSEPATAAGTIAVLQRHAEGAMRGMVQSFSGVIESYKEQVNAQRTLIADFQRQAAENFRLQEGLASRKLEQDITPIGVASQPLAPTQGAPRRSALPPNPRRDATRCQLNRTLDAGPRLVTNTSR